MPSSKFLYIILILSFCLLLVGCSAYQNVTAYFNTYYNASKLFSDTEREIAKTPQKDRDTNYFAAYNLPKSIEDKLDRIIEKNSKLIQFYPQSSWITDAIMMIGKSYAYKAEHESALRKFAELMQNFPTSGQRFEAKLWSAKALYQMKKDDEALRLTKELFPEARQEGKNDILLETLLLEAQIYFGRGEYQQAATTYALAVEVSGNNKLRSIGQQRLAVCYERLGDLPKAAEAYGRVRKFDPDFPVEIRSRLKEGTMYSMSGKYQHAFDIFEDLRSEGLKNDDRALVELETANTFKRMGDSARALQWYDFIDSVYARTDASAKSYYERGKIYEYELHNYKTALKYYEKAQAENAASEITPLAQRKFAMLTTYFSLNTNRNKYDTLLMKVLHPDTVAQKQDSSLANNDSIKTSDTVKTHLASTIFPDSIGGKKDSLRAQASNKTPDSTAVKFAVPDSSLSVLRPPTDDGDLRDDDPHSRRQGKADLVKGRLLDKDDIPPKKGAGRKDSLDRVKKAGSKSSISSPPKLMPLTPDSVRSLIAQTEFELAGLFYLQFDLLDSALVWYQKVVSDHQTSPFVPKALYAISEIYRTHHDSLVVDSLYQIILDRYGNTEYAVQVRKLRGFDVTSLQIDSADTKYREAEKQLQGGNVTEALSNFSRIAKEYPLSPFAPKALYAVGWVYESILVKNDSAAVWYKTLIKDYPLSAYAVNAKPKVAVKDDPKSLSQYIKIKEIQPMRHLIDPRQQFQPDVKDTKQSDEDEEEDLQQGRHGNRQDLEDKTDEEEDEPVDPDDDNNN